MSSQHDYRSEKMESREGLGLAMEARKRWEEKLPADVWDAAWGHTNSPETLDRLLGKDRAEAFRKKIQREAKERADLMGFWIAWHTAGGFAALEAGGWNRATLFRKVKRFRTVFGSHPDEHSFDFVELDLPRAWLADLIDALG